METVPRIERQKQLFGMKQNEINLHVFVSWSFRKCLLCEDWPVGAVLCELGTARTSMHARIIEN